MMGKLSDAIKMSTFKMKNGSIREWSFQKQIICKMLKTNPRWKNKLCEKIEAPPSMKTIKKRKSKIQSNKWNKTSEIK